MMFDCTYPSRPSLPFEATFLISPAGYPTAILKCMEKSDPQRSMLVEAKDAATKIAQAETDDQTTRAAIMIGLERSVQGFPVSDSPQPSCFWNLRSRILP